MKRLLTMLLVVVFCLGIVVNATPMDTTKVDEKFNQLKAINTLEKETGKNNKEFKIEWNQEKGVPSFIKGQLSKEAVQNEIDAVNYMINQKDMFKLDKAEFSVKSTETDKLNMKHYKLAQTSDNIPVYGSEMIVHTDADGNVCIVNGNIENTVPAKAWKKMINLNENKAIKIAEASLNLNAETQEYTAEPSAKAYIYNHKGEWMPIFHVTLQFIYPYPANIKVFINAETGDIIKTRNDVMDTAATGTGISTLGGTRALNLDYTNSKYYLKDVTGSAVVSTYTANNGTSIPGTMMYDTDTTFDAEVQKAAVDAHYNTGLVRDYYINVLGRNSFDGNGAEMRSTVHYGSQYNNAFWNGSQMTYGDGDGQVFSPLSGALDIIAHEFTHGVTSYTCNLEYQDQSGAFNEHISDAFGYLVAPKDWLIGEDVYTPNTSGDALRSMADPTLYDQPAHMNDYVNTTEDNGGVHTNCGIPNKAFYLAATNINNNTYMANIYYRAMTTYLTQYSTFEQGKTALVQSATDLYGATVAQQIADAFTAVGIGSTTPANDTYEPNGSTTAAYGPLTSGTTYDSYIASSTDVDYYYFDIANTGAISVTCGNLAGDYDIYLYNSSGTQVGSSLKSGTSAEAINYTATATGRYYVKVLGYSGACSTTVAYALAATYPTGTTPTGQWYDETMVIESPHDYTNNYNNTQQYSKTGATKVRVHFSRFETETNYDKVYIKDSTGATKAQYTGTLSAFWAEVDGDTIQINLVSDYSVTDYGYYIDMVSYYSNGQLITENIAPLQ